MGNAASSQHQGKPQKLKDANLEQVSPDSVSWPFSASPLAGPSVDLYQERDASQYPAVSCSTSQAYLQDRLHQDAASATLSNMESRESLSAFLTPKASQSQLTAPSQSCATFDSKQVDVKSAIALLEELRKTASPEDLVALHRALLPIRASETTIPTPSTAAVSRPQSLAAPGILARSSQSSSNVHWDYAARHTSWQAEIREVSPLPQTERQFKNEHELAPRAMTPGDMDRSHLGSVNLGTLVVTNGSPASPGSSIVGTPRSTPKEITGIRCREQEFRSGEEARSSVEYEHVKKKNSLDMLSLDNSEADRLTKANSSLLADLRTQFEDPLAQTLQRGNSLTSTTSEQSDKTQFSEKTRYTLNDDAFQARQASTKQLKSPRKKLSKAAPVRVSAVRLHDLFSEEFDHTSDKEALPDRFHHVQQAPNASATNMANEYSEEYSAGLPDSPSSDLFPIPPRSISPDLPEVIVNEVIINDDRQERYIVSSNAAEQSLTSSKETYVINLNPYAPWTSGVISPQTALKSHPLVVEPVLSHNTSLSSRPSCSSRPSQQSDSGYSTASRHGREKSPLAETPIVVNFTRESHSIHELGHDIKDNGSIHPALHDFAFQDSSEQRAIFNSQDAFRTITPRASNVSVMHGPIKAKAADRTAKNKSWRDSRILMSRFLTLESASDKDYLTKYEGETEETRPVTATSNQATKPTKDNKQKKDTRLLKESRTPKKLQKKRPVSDIARPLVNISIPDIPTNLTSKLQNRHEVYDDRVVIGTPYEINEHSKTPMMHCGDAIAKNHASEFNLTRPLPIKAATEPVQPTRRPPPPPAPLDVEVLASRVPKQNRSSLTRLLRPKSMVKEDRKMLGSEEDLDTSLFPAEFSSMSNVSKALGASPYDIVNSTSRINTIRDEHWQPSPIHLQQINPPAQQLPQQHVPVPQGIFTPRLPRPGHRPNQRPKSFHGRTAARKMQIVGEESLEDIAYEAMMSSRNTQQLEISSANLQQAQHHAKPHRPQSMKSASSKSYLQHHDNILNHPTHHFPLQNKPSWSGPSDLWRNHREAAVLNTRLRSIQTSRSPRSSHDTGIVGRPMSPIELPAISIEPQSRSQTSWSERIYHLQENKITLPSRRPRPRSELMTAKSQPELRDRARYASHLSDAIGYATEYEPAQKIHPMLVPRTSTLLYSQQSDQRHTTHQ